MSQLSCDQLPPGPSGWGCCHHHEYFATKAPPPEWQTPPPVFAVNPPPNANPISPDDDKPPPVPTGVPGITLNAGGVPQAKALSGVSPDSIQVVNTGTGTDKTFNVTNVTSHTQSFTYSVQGVNKGTITLQPGQTGTFIAGSGDLGVRISPSDANGNTRPNTVLFEDGGAANGQPAGVGNPDVSKVDGSYDFAGNKVNMTITLSDGRTAGDGNAIHAYAFSTDDAASMGLAGDPSKTVNIVLSDA